MVQKILHYTHSFFSFKTQTMCQSLVVLDILKGKHSYIFLEIL